MRVTPNKPTNVTYKQKLVEDLSKMLITTPDLRRTPSVHEDPPETRNREPVEFKLDETVIEQRVQLE